MENFRKGIIYNNYSSEVELEQFLECINLDIKLKKCILLFGFPTILIAEIVLIITGIVKGVF